MWWQTAFVLLCGVAQAPAAGDSGAAQAKAAQAKAAQAKAAQAVAPQAVSASQWLDLGVADLRAGRIEAAVAALDRVVELDPPSMPYLWQRGIAQYFAGQYRQGREQFEAHRLVNPRDVENATWHFICVAAVDGVDAARKGILPAPGDGRAPMREVYALYAGTGDRAAVEARVDAFPTGSRAHRSARFYADLYLGLLDHAEGNAAAAAKHLQAAAAVPDQNVMADVARVAYQRLVKDAQPSKTQPPKVQPSNAQPPKTNPESGSAETLSEEGSE